MALFVSRKGSPEDVLLIRCSLGARRKALIEPLNGAGQESVRYDARPLRRGTSVWWAEFVRVRLVPNVKRILAASEILPRPTKKTVIVAQSLRPEKKKKLAKSYPLETSRRRKLISKEEQTLPPFSESQKQ